MVKVYFETSSYAQLVACFEDEETYNECSDALEALATKHNFEFVSESVIETPLEMVELIGKDKETYVLFGESICIEYDEGIEQAVDFALDNPRGYGISKFDQNSSIVDILSESERWATYSIIPKEDYEKIINA